MYEATLRPATLSDVEKLAACETCAVAGMKAIAIAIAAGHEMVDATTGKTLTYNKEDLHNPWFIVR